MAAAAPAAAARPGAALAAALVALAALTGCGSAGSDAPAASGPDIVVRDATVRIPANPDVAAGYLTMENKGGTGDTLTGAETDAAEEVQMHDTREEDGAMTMVEQQEVPIGAGETVEFSTGGLHLMLMDPADLEVGDTVALTLRFAESGTVETEAAVVDPMDGSDGSDGHGHHDHHDHHDRRSG
ncbi:MAG: copper chaperone PCu(A)C [Nocardiopsaceae bacterium]|nr:copper chaperone PCu(A)C [Nocardiopsaceae bacterium]